MRNILGFARPLKVNVSSVQYTSILRTPKGERFERSVYLYSSDP